MAKFRKRTERLIKEILELRESRQSIDDFNFNFLKNFSEYSQLMHFTLKKDNVSKEFKETAYRQYFVFLVSCWETYFRDIFVYVYSGDIQSIKKLIQEMKITESTPELGDITLEELLSKSFNFQNIDSIKTAYSSLWGDDFLEYICNIEITSLGLNGKIMNGFVISSLFPEWQEILHISFNTRHKVIHDANYRPDFDNYLIQQAEALFLMIPQLATYFLAEHFNLETIAITDGKYQIPYLFSIHDILADDWQVVT